MYFLQSNLKEEIISNLEALSPNTERLSSTCNSKKDKNNLGINALI